jgi:hypothetical protein
LSFELVRYEILAGVALFQLLEVRDKQLLTCVCEGTVTSSRAALSLVTEALSEKIWVVKELRGAVAVCALVAVQADPVVVKLIRARLRAVTLFPAFR